MRFQDRLDAAAQLAPLLEKYRHEDAVILAVPRGGVPIGHYLSRRLRLPLDLLMSKKLGHPKNPEFAIGAVSLEGSLVAEDIPNIATGYIEAEVQKIRQKLKRRYEKFMGGRQPLDLKDKTVIVVDDGIATGRTLLATVPLLRGRHPRRIVIAVPVAPPDTAEEMRAAVDDFVCPLLPRDFYGVGAFYEDFSEVTDEEVIDLLREQEPGPGGRL